MCLFLSQTGKVFAADTWPETVFTLNGNMENCTVKESKTQ